MRDIPNSTGKIMDLIDSGRFEEAERHVAGVGLVEDPLQRILDAELETYFCRRERAAELISGINPASLDARSLPRYLMALGNHHYSLYEYDRAQELFEAAYHTYKVLGDRYQIAHSLYNLGRLKLKQGKTADAEPALSQAKESLREEETAKSDYLLGLVEYNLGTCRFHAGEHEEARSLFDSAIKLLQETEHCRHYASALSTLGRFLVSSGRYSEALEPLKEAQTILSNYAISDELAITASNLALVLVRTTNYDEAERVLMESVDVHQRVGDVRGLSISYRSLAELYLERNEVAKAEKYANDAIAQAELAKDETLQATARTVAGRVASRRRDYGNAGKFLHAAQEIAQRLGDPMLEGQACLYLAEAYYSTSPVKAQEFVSRAAELLQGFHDPWIEQELQRISQRSTTERIKLTPENKLVFDGNFLPNWYAAKEALEQFLLKNALKQSAGNLTKAGEILGITKVHVHNLKKQFGI